MVGLAKWEREGLWPPYERDHNPYLTPKITGDDQDDKCGLDPCDRSV